MPDFDGREYALASDGLPARRNGRYAERKLEFLDRFLPPALNATKTKHRRWYLDLFAGPGMCIDTQDPTHEYPGSPLRALPATAPLDVTTHFTNAVCVNLNERDWGALQQRIERACADGRSRVRLAGIRNLLGDSNALLPDIMREIPPLDYVFVFADIEGVRQLPWRTVTELKRYGHVSIDLYLLFPLEMAIKRLISYSAAHTAKHAARLSAFFGDDAWKALADERITDTQSPRLWNGLEQLYIDKLHSLGWRHVAVQRDVVIRGRRGLYHMLFASNSDVADTLANWERSTSGPGQLSLEF